MIRDKGPRLVVVSNRGAYRMRETPDGIKYERSVGGLATAVLPVLEEYSGVWISSGRPAGRFPNVPGRPSFDIENIELSPDEERYYYYGLANEALWPLCHYFLDRVCYNHTGWEMYDQVNRRFADAALADAGPDDLIWIHDYHLARVPGYLRHARPEARIALFWHIPFPAPEVFRTFPWRRELLESMLASDLIGFHVPEYVKNFIENVADILGAHVEGEVVRYAGHQSQVIACPIGIDYAGLEKQARSKRVAQRADRLCASVQGQRLIVGVERLDYTKGIAERLRGVERLLDTRPEWRGKVTLYQIITPSREEGVESYREKKREVDELIGRINGKFSNDLWTPIHYLNRAFNPARLIVYYRAADIALVTPLRDGLNLVAKEYVAARVNQDGVLILSEFAGASSQLPEALLVNPYSDDDMANSLEYALLMTKDEQRRRMRAMQSRIKEQDISWWTKQFLDRMRAIQHA